MGEKRDTKHAAGSDADCTAARIINLEYHPHDSRIRIAGDEIVQTLNNRMGTGGGNVPLVLIVAEED